MKLIVFTYAPAGLGHLRVTGALVHSRPKNIPYVLIGSTDILITSIHRFTSINPFARRIFEASQYGLFEDIFTLVYVWWLKNNSETVYKKMLSIISEHPDVSEITVVATHFGLAHQIGVIKERILRETKVKINLIVQVTDDTSQHIWCVEGADLTMVPSELTRKNLNSYANSRGMRFNCVVSPYPISPVLTEKIPTKEGDRNTAFLVGERDPINVIIPISGAAVGLNYLAVIMSQIDRLSSRFRFFVVAKRSSSTRNFLMKLGKMRWVELITGRNDNEVVRLYERTYQENLIHIEITKPSEQSFKAMIPPSMIGGSILLFTTPVGRQEFDNINFLQRHCLVPLSDKEGVSVVPKDKCVPRALNLPKDPEEAAKLIVWCLQKGLFAQMSDPNYKYSPDSLMSGEVNHRGSWLFWEELKIAKLI